MKPKNKMIIGGCAILVIAMLAVLFNPIYERITPATYTLNDGKGTIVNLMDGFGGKPITKHEWRLMQEASAIEQPNIWNANFDMDSNEERGAWAYGKGCWYRYVYNGDTNAAAPGYPMSFDIDDSTCKAYKVEWATEVAQASQFAGIVSETIPTTKYGMLQVAGYYDGAFVQDTTTIGEFLYPYLNTDGLAYANYPLNGVGTITGDCTYVYFAVSMEAVDRPASTATKQRIYINAYH